MFGPTQKIFTVYEKPEAAEPADRMLLLRDGFSYWAFVFGIFWLLMHRMWRVAALFFAAQVAIAFAGEVLGFSPTSLGLLQLWLQVMLGFHAFELQGATLARRGYRLGGVLVAESEMHAERRYHEFAA
jgi:hypothetical protein